VLTTVDVAVDRRGGSTAAASVDHRTAGPVAANPVRYEPVDRSEFLATPPAPGLSTCVGPDGATPTEAGVHWLATGHLAEVRGCGTRHQPTLIGPEPAAG